MFPVLASLVDLAHALFMVGWIAGLPLLFWHRHPRATRWYAIYAIAFIVLYQASRVLLGECFLTTISRYLWEQGGAPPRAAHEWFTVRIAMAVFHMAPSHKAITIAGQILVFASAVGMLLTLRRQRYLASGAAGGGAAGAAGAAGGGGAAGGSGGGGGGAAAAGGLLP